MELQRPAVPPPDESTFDLLIRATETIEYPNWSLAGESKFAVGERRFHAPIMESARTPQDLILKCRDSNHEFHRTDMGPYGSTAPVFTALAPDSSWEFHGGFLAGTGISSTIGDHATLHFRSFDQRLRDGEVATSALVYVDAPTVVFPDRLPVPTGMRRPRFMEHGLQCSLFGHHALIRGVEMSELSDFGRAIVVVWDGPPLSGSRPRALRIVLSFLLGGWVQPVMSYTTDRDGHVLRRRITALGDPLRRAHTPPLELRFAQNVRDIGTQLDGMLSRCERLLGDEVELDVALGHLFADHDGIDIEIRDVALTLDSLVESPLFKPPRRRLIAKPRFVEVKASLLERLSEIITAEESEFVGRVANVLALAQHDSTGDRRRAFWEAVGFNLSERELEALEHRDTMSHAGYIAFDHADDAAWNALVRDAHILRTLVNRVILALLGFNGDAMSYETGELIHVTAAAPIATSRTPL
ncbi:MAG TPA: hypothetical protein VGU66_01565 [Candidatus Elarobacter sp.]|nr:hypothetical protein [Candidatus Elarobacter sp.]